MHICILCVLEINCGIMWETCAAECLLTHSHMDDIGLLTETYEPVVLAFVNSCFSPTLQVDM